MFEFLFKYPAGTFAKGDVIFLAPWPLWLLALGVLAAAGLLFYHMRRHRGLLTGVRPVAVWLLQTAMVALLLFLLWHPALSIATLEPQQNIVAVVVDNSRSMQIQEGGSTRLAVASKTLQDGFLDELSKLVSHLPERLSGELDVRQSLVEAGDRPLVHLRVRAVAAVDPHYRRLVPKAPSPALGGSPRTAARPDRRGCRRGDRSRSSVRSRDTRRSAR